MRSRLAASEKRYLNRQRVCHVASVAADGRPHAAPLSHAYDDANRTLYIATERSGRTATNVRAHPRAAVTFDDYSENWDGLHGVILQTRARKLERGAEFERACMLLTKKFRQYKTIEIDYVVALKVEGVIASWGL
jgi:nitroimidazol reductase NimA-like FMN-containing flavoprotein (pyridoxamine 5'-phosphate oxidase superfamily)